MPKCLKEYQEDVLRFRILCGPAKGITYSLYRIRYDGVLLVIDDNQRSPEEIFINGVLHILHPEDEGIVWEVAV